MELDQKIKSNDHDNTIFEEDEPLLLPGFRFSPTDEELLGFYLRRKVEKKCTNIELIIKHVDIYNYNPWDLPIGAVGEKEMYVFCKRGRKYKNSFRPNRVAGSGFWKATGIDKLIYDRHRCNIVIGLKKTLVFYCGSAGKGTKTNWMMHEFRLPPTTSKTNLEQAEVWTVCRILKREVGHKKNISSSSKQKQNQVVDWSCYETIIRCSSSESDNVDDQVKSKTTSTNTTTSDNIDDQLVAATSNYVRPVGDDYDIDGASSWDELRPMIHFIL